MIILNKFLIKNLVENFVNCFFEIKMRRLLIVFLLVFNCVYAKLYPIAVRLPLKYDPPPVDASLWPKPLEHETTKSYMFLNRDTFKFIISEKVNVCEEDILKRTISRYMNILFPPILTYKYPEKDDTQFESIQIRVNNSKSKFNSCEKDYYPLIEDTEQEKCKFSYFK
jgi:hypothetical protein